MYLWLVVKVIFSNPVNEGINSPDNTLSAFVSSVNKIQ
jgi:hypothetical protein